MIITHRTYLFVTTFVIAAPVTDVSLVLADYPSWSKWWRGLKTLKVEKILGVIPQKVHFTIGFPLYSLKMTLVPIEVDPLKKLVFSVIGDLEGTGTFILTEENDQTTLRFEWNVRTTKPWMNLIEPIGRPFFVFGHNRIMKWFGEGLAEHLKTDLSSFSSVAR